MRKYFQKKKLQRSLSKITQKIIEGYQPEKIILFGSATSGKLSWGSDIDLLVIKATNKNYWERQKEILSFCEGWIPVDIFVLTPEEFNQAQKENRFFLTEEILPKGKLIYDRR